MLTLVLLSSGTRCLAQKLQRPQALIGWEISMGEELRLIELPSKAAPLLPAWPIHGNRNPKGHSTLFSGDSEGKQLVARGQEHVGTVKGTPCGMKEYLTEGPVGKLTVGQGAFICCYVCLRYDVQTECGRDPAKLYSKGCLP